MRPGSSNSLVWAFAALALGSLGLKAIAGPPRDGIVGERPGAFEQLASAILRSQHFSVRERSHRVRSTILFAERGACRLAVRSAMRGSGFVPIFAAEARGVGPVVYFFRGQRYATPPEFRMRLARLQTEALNRLAVSADSPAVVAFAESPACGASHFGLADLRVRD